MGVDIVSAFRKVSTKADQAHSASLQPDRRFTGTWIVHTRENTNILPPEKEVVVDTSKKNDLLSRKLYLWVVPPRPAQ